MPTETLNIGELAKRSGTAPDTLRYYERIGLLAPSSRSTGGYRRYEESAVDRLAFIHRAQALGLTLAEVREIIGIADQGGVPCRHVQATLARHLDEVDARIAELRLLRNSIAELLAPAPKTRGRNACVCGLIENAADVPIQRGLNRITRRRRARQTRLTP